MKHAEEELHKCRICEQEVCGICDAYINPVTTFAITKEVWDEYPLTVKFLCGMLWPKEAWFAHLACIRKKEADAQKLEDKESLKWQLSMKEKEVEELKRRLSAMAESPQETKPVK